MLMDKFGDKLTDYLMYFSVGVSMIIALVLFFLLPVVLGSLFNKFISGTYLLGVIEGLIRIAIFLVYIFIISRMKEIKRVYEYHGAEHKTINCFESGKALTVENLSLIHILDYNRVVKDLNGMTSEEFMNKLAEKFDIHEADGRATVSYTHLLRLFFRYSVVKHR